MSASTPIPPHQVVRKSWHCPNSDFGTNLFLQSKHNSLQNNLDSGHEDLPALRSFRVPITITILHDRKNSQSNCTNARGRILSCPEQTSDNRTLHHTAGQRMRCPQMRWSGAWTCTLPPRTHLQHPACLSTGLYFLRLQDCAK